MEEPPQRAIAERQPASGQLSAQFLKAHVAARLEDLPLLARHLLQHARDTDPTAFAHLAGLKV